MKYIFFGTPKFAAIILEKLINAGMLPVALVCNPDKPVGREQIITPPPTKELVIRNQALGIRVFQPESIDNLKFELQNLFKIRNSKFDFFLVAAYNKILPKEMIEMPRLGSIGVHPSLLPKYRGSSPIQSVILAGKKEAGVSLFLMDEKVDHGPIISSKKLVVSTKDNYETLEKKLAELAGDLLVEALPRFVEGGTTPLPQDELQATYTKKFTSEDAFISLEDLELATSGASPEKAEEIHRKIRALNPEPGVWTIQEGRRVKFLEAELGKRKLILKRIQEAGKKPMSY